MRIGIRHFTVLSIILFIGDLQGQELKHMQIVGKPEKSATEFVGSNVRDVNGRICAAIQVISDMDGFSYDAYNGVIKVDPKPGMDMVYLQPDERVFEIYRSGFSPLKVILSEYGIYLREREVWLLRVVGDKPVTSIPVTILIEPEGATLEINGKEGGTGPVYQLSHGEHVFRISRPGYQSQEHRVQVDETNVFFRYILEEKPDVDVRITSTPPGATVFLENVELGSTPLAVFYPEGRYNLRVEMRGYVTHEKTLDIKLPSVKESIRLEENVGYLSIRTDPKATVFLNGKITAKRQNIKLSPMLVRVRVTLPKAEPLERQVIIKRNSREVLEIFPVVLTGSVQVAVSPFDAYFELKGDTGDHYTSTGPKQFTSIPIGTYVLSVSKSGYETHKETIVLRSGERVNRSIQLKERSAAPVADTSYTKRVRAPGTMTGNDEKAYKTVKIGNQIWMAENLKETKYRDGSTIPVVTDNSQWTNLTTGARCVYDNKESNANTYGYLYNWYAVNDRRNIAPPGWRVSTDADWKELERALGMSRSDADKKGWRGSPAGSKLAGNASLWRSGLLTSHSQFGSSGFSTLPAGNRRYTNGYFYYLGLFTYFWTASEGSADDAWNRDLNFSKLEVHRHDYPKRFGFSVRLVKDD